MHNEMSTLLGEWVVKLVMNDFQAQKQAYADKLFVRIQGIDDDGWVEILGQFQQQEEALAQFYIPVIRTMTAIPGYEEYSCREHETSTWLRNNTSPGSALIIAMNERSPEAQSLENIFTIDEARLLGEDGLDVLYAMLSDKYKLFGEELTKLQLFMEMYHKIAEPQLHNILSFLSAIVENTQESVIDSIQSNLDRLQLFRDHRLILNKAQGKSRLERNYQLSKLERGGRSVDKVGFVERVYQFIEKTTGEGGAHELWERVDPDTFLQQALNFIHRVSYKLYEYEFEHMSEVLNFNPGKPKLNERVNEFKAAIAGAGEWSKERDGVLTDALEAIEEHRNPENIKAFLDEFSVELTEEPRLKRELERNEARIRHTPEYTELYVALLQECLLMLEKAAAERELDGVTFILRLIAAPEGNEEAHQAWAFHLLNLNRLTSYISFEHESLNDFAKSDDKGNALSFELRMVIQNQIIDRARFRLKEAFDGMLPVMIREFAERGFVPHTREFFGQDLQVIDVRDEVRKRVEGYIATHEDGFEQAVESLAKFIDDYEAMLQRGIKQGLCSIDFQQLEQMLEQVLSPKYCSAMTALHVYQYLNVIGVHDRYDRKITDSIGYVKARILTILHPFRLIGYAKRLMQIHSVIDHWLGPKADQVESLDGLDVYLQQLQEETAHLSPRYFAVEGEPDQFLIEQQERMGEGTFAVNGISSGEEQLVDLFSTEMLATVKAYLEVYPYAKDCLDLVFLFCPHADYVTKAVDKILHHTKVDKIRAVVHSATNGSNIYDTLNGWLNRSEEYTATRNGFPKVEIQVIAEHEMNQTMNTITRYLQDADIGVLVNYFGQTSHILYKMEKVPVESSLQWFGTIYKEPLKRDDAVKRISYVSEMLPIAMQGFYRLQHLMNSGQTPEEGDHYLLRNTIAVGRSENAALIDYMHERFNWSLFIDRYLDKSLLRKVSSKAQIIKYKSRTGDNKDYRTLVSSSKYIHKLAQQLDDHEYYDRLYCKIALLLKNKNIGKNAIVGTVERVKDISGGIVMRAIGPGKFAHEMMAIDLATQAAHRASAAGELVVWSVCDELPWFQGGGRRPDLVRTSISRNGERLALRFELIELKFTSHTIWVTERFDAVKQVRAGMELYRSKFDFLRQPIGGELWRKELIHYLLEFGEYSVADAALLKDLQGRPLSEIDVEITGAVDSFVYTSNLQELSIMEGHVHGYQMEMLQNEYPNHIYNRAYILRALGAEREAVVPEYESLQEISAYMTGRFDIESDVASSNEGSAFPMTVPASAWSEPDREPGYYREVAATREQQEVADTQCPYPNDAQVKSGLLKDASESYPEQLAMQGVELPDEDQLEDLAPLVERYQKKLRSNFNQLGISLRIVDAVIGVSVIRLLAEIPADKSFSSVENKAKDMELWLELSSAPLVRILNGKINIDITRDSPETVYFGRFMAMVRKEYPGESLRGRLVAPLGVGQMREIIAVDFSDSSTPHLLIGGTTGSGKSVTMNAVILAMMCLYNPSEVQFLFLDPKKVEFSFYNGWPHTRQVITEIEEAIDALECLVQKMDDRYELLMREGFEHIGQYVEETGNSLPRLVVVFDEFADFMEREKSLSSRVESAIMRLGQKARAAGIHLIICTQNPKADIIPTNIRNNLPARLALKAADHHASK